jgi:hypothetical protein
MSDFKHFSVQVALLGYSKKPVTLKELVKPYTVEELVRAAGLAPDQIGESGTVEAFYAVDSWSASGSDIVDSDCEIEVSYAPVEE